MLPGVLTPELLRLWERLAALEGLNDSFVLAGGTALAVQLGHRQSFDLDFFSEADFRPETVERLLEPLQPEMVSQALGTLHVRIDDCKVSFLSYPYPWLEAPILHHGLRLACVPDVAAMKIVAVSQRGTKKDFFDLRRIVQDHQPEEVKAWFLQKYGTRRINCYHILRSLFYFADAEPDPDPISLDGTTWAEVKQFFLTQEPRWFQTLLS